MWFESLTGFAEGSPANVRANISVDGPVLTSRVNGKSYVCGTLTLPSLAELRAAVASSGAQSGNIAVREQVADVQQLHMAESNAGALFQVASQFNLLEMVGPHVTPEQGVGVYEHDRTQGPACAIAAGAGTIYRNYFAPVNGRIGQSADNQIDCLADLGRALGNEDQRLWEMRNGYALPSQAALVEISGKLAALDEPGRDSLRQLLRIGIHSNTQVTIGNCRHLVSQAYCSALPVAYSSHAAHLWEPFARLALEASYEATFCAAILNAAGGSSNRLFLTLLGGGAFGNDIAWIIDAIKRAVQRYRHADLDVAIVSYGRSNPSVRQLVEESHA